MAVPRPAMYCDIVRVPLPDTQVGRPTGATPLPGRTARCPPQCDLPSVGKGTRGPPEPAVPDGRPGAKTAPPQIMRSPPCPTAIHVTPSTARNARSSPRWSQVQLTRPLGRVALNVPHASPARTAADRTNNHGVQPRRRSGTAAHPGATAAPETSWPGPGAAACPCPSCGPPAPPAPRSPPRSSRTPRCGNDRTW
jgi:hypothetical protein